MNRKPVKVKFLSLEDTGLERIKLTQGLFKGMGETYDLLQHCFQRDTNEFFENLEKNENEMTEELHYENYKDFLNKTLEIVQSLEEHIRSDKEFILKELERCDENLKK